MSVLGIILLLACAAALVAARRNVPGAKAVVVVCAIGASVLSARNLWSGGKQSSRNDLVGEEQAAGKVLASLLLAEVNQGTVLILRNPPMEGASREISAARCEGFLAACKESPLRLVQAGPRRSGSIDATPDFVFFSEAALQQEANAWLAAHKDVRAVVSLLPVWPNLNPGAPVYAFLDVSRDASWVNGIKNGRIKAAIIYRLRPSAPDANPEAASGNGLPAKFILVTKDNVDAAVKELSF